MEAYCRIVISTYDNAHKVRLIRKVKELIINKNSFISYSITHLRCTQSIQKLKLVGSFIIDFLIVDMQKPTISSQYLYIPLLLEAEYSTFL